MKLKKMFVFKNLKQGMFSVAKIAFLCVLPLSLNAQTLIPSNEILHRDPFIFVSQKEHCYYLISSSSPNLEGRLQVYRSQDLKQWEKRGRVVPQEGLYKDALDWWAPDVYEWKGNYYIFVTVSSEKEKRGTMIFRSKDGIEGKYEPVREDVFTMTPKGMQCLDASLYIDRKGHPWMLFCHEWLECYDGEIWAQRLSKDLSRTKGKPIKLFSASEAPWCAPIDKKNGKDCYVTDAPFIIRDDATGNLLMLWSSFTEKNGRRMYTYAQAVSESGRIEGPWKQAESSFNADDGGHTMIFRDLEGQLRVSYHSPNSGACTLTLGRISIENGRLIPYRVK